MKLLIVIVILCTDQSVVVLGDVGETNETRQNNSDQYRYSLFVAIYAGVFVMCEYRYDV